MFTHCRTIVRVVAASLVFVAATANAQGKSHEKGNGRDKGKDERIETDNRDRNRDRDHDRNEDQGRDRNRDRSHDVFVNGAKVPPGLAKKPGGMPPGQYKKRYGTTQGASVLSEILGRRGYTVVRTTPYGESQYVYYRASDGAVRRAIVSPNGDRLTFSNVPADLLREVLARLY